MLDQIVTEAAGQVPALCVLVFLVLQFMKFLRSRDDFLKDMADRCHEHQDKATKAIDKNIEVAAHMLEAIRRCPGAMHTIGYDDE
jgi:hypothetical protein